MDDNADNLFDMSAWEASAEQSNEVANLREMFDENVWVRVIWGSNVTPDRT